MLFILVDLDKMLLTFLLELNENKHWVILGGFLAYLVIVTLRILCRCKKVTLKKLNYSNIYHKSFRIA